MLSEFLRQNRAELIARCRARVLARRAPRATPAELEHGVPIFLDHLTDMIERETGKDAPPAYAGHEAETRIEAGASQHGAELLRHDFSVDQVVHDYGDLCQAITELAVQRGAPITVQEFGLLNIRLDNAIAGAVTEFERQRDVIMTGQHGRATNERLGHLAHAMRNLLNTSMLAISAMKAGSVGFGGSTAAALDRSLIGMRALIDRTLADVRLGSDDPPLTESLEIGELFADLRVGAAFEASQKGVHLTVLVLEPGLHVKADRHILCSTISNVLHNAFAFTRPGSHVFLKAHAAHGRVLIDVEDECGGLPQGAEEAIFRPFEARGKGREGGLAVSRDAIHSAGGTLTVRNVPGKGCVFTVDLPRETIRLH